MYLLMLVLFTRSWFNLVLFVISWSILVYLAMLITPSEQFVPQQLDWSRSGVINLQSQNIVIGLGGALGALTAEGPLLDVSNT